MVFFLYLILFLLPLYWRQRQLVGPSVIENTGQKSFETVSVSYSGWMNAVWLLLTFRYDKSEYVEKLSPSGGYGASFQFGVPLSRPFYMSIVRERWYHQTLKNLGLAEEIQTGDAELDAKLFLVSDQPAQLAALLETKKQKAKLLRLFHDSRIRSLRAFGTKLWLQGKTLHAGGFMDLETERKACFTQLRDIAEEIDALPEDWSNDPQIRHFGSPHLGIFCMALHGALLTLGLFGWVPLAFEQSEIIAPMPLILVSIFILPLIAIIWFKKITSVMGRDGWGALFVVDFMLVGLMGIALSGFVALREINIRLDMSEPKIRQIAVAGKECSMICDRGFHPASGRGNGTMNAANNLFPWQMPRSQCTLKARERFYNKCWRRISFSYEITFPPLHPSAEDFILPVDATLYDATEDGDIFNIPVHAGLFGAKWINQAEITKAEQP